MDGLDVALLRAAVPQRLPSGHHPAVERRLAHVPFGPDAVEQLVLRDHPAGMLDEHSKHLDDLRLEGDGRAVAAQFEGIEVELEPIERKETCSLARGRGGG